MIQDTSFKKQHNFRNGIYWTGSTRLTGYPILSNKTISNETEKQIQNYESRGSSRIKVSNKLHILNTTNKATAIMFINY